MKHTLHITSEKARQKCLQWVQKVPLGWDVEFREGKRSTDQNAALWAALQDIADQKEYHGMKLPKEDWKLLFMDALGREVKVIPNLEGTGLVQIGTHSSHLDKQSFSDLLEIVFAWGAENGVVFKDGGKG